MNKPKCIEDYEKWIVFKKWTTNIFNLQNYYERIAVYLKGEIEKTLFWKELNTKLISFNEDYCYLKKEYNLLNTSNLPVELKTKEYKSFLDKTYRKNIIHNKNWRNAPKGGWIKPENWFSKIGDIVRAEIKVEYLDGVDFLKSRIIKLAKKHKIKYKEEYLANIDGYYSLHLNLFFPLEIPTGWKTKKIIFNLEIQITTEVQGLIRKLTHMNYEIYRSMAASNKKKLIPWQWILKSDEFNTNYLGHIIHYIEGKILEVRDKKENI